MLRPKVLIVPSWYPSPHSPTAGIFVQQQARALAAQGMDVAVLYVERVGVPDAEITVRRVEGVLEVLACPQSPLLAHSPMVRKFLGLVRHSVGVIWYRALTERCIAALEATGFRPDVVHVHALWPAGTIGDRIARRWDAPLLVTEHSIEYLPGSGLRLLRIPGMLRFRLRPLALRAKILIAVSGYFADILRSLNLNDDVRVVPNIVPQRIPTPRPTDPVQRIVNVSHLSPAKNIPALISAAVQLHQRRADFTLDLVGDGSCRAELEDLVRSHCAGEYIRFHGLLSPEGVFDVIDRSSFAVLSSSLETFSVFAAEALMLGRPVLTTNIGGPTSFVSEAVGRVVPASDSSALADGMEWMLDHAQNYDPAVLSEYAAARFSAEAVVPQLEHIYDEVTRVQQ